VAGLNSFIAPLSTAATDTAAEVQAIVNTYQLLLAGADGNGTNNNVQLSAAQYQLLGLNHIDTAAETSLLNDVVDAKTATAVDESSELQALADIVSRLMTTALGGQASPALTAADFAALGITGVSSSNLQGVLLAIGELLDTASVDSLSDLQNRVNVGISYATQVPVISIGTLSGDDTVNAVEKSSALAISGQATHLNDGQVTVQLKDGSTVLASLTAQVNSGAWSANLTAETLASLTDKTYTVEVSGTNSYNNSGIQTRSLSVDTTPPALVVTHIAGDPVSSGTRTALFDATERGPLTTTADSTVTPTTVVTSDIVISGTSDAGDGRTVSVILNGVTYTTTVNAGNWSVTLPDPDSIALNHGNTYSVSASVSDAAGNSNTDTASSLKVDIAPPDVPTVVSQITKDNTPTVTGNAFKVNPNAAGQYIKLEAGDLILVVLGGTHYNLTVGSALANPLAYDTATGVWTLNVPTALTDGI
jgi:hypothetical protein